MRYLHLDVFTDRPFEGNQLAVFPEPGDASPELMQAITREMNFSECTFIFPPDGGGDVRMRIFTPDRELPMAGHPTIGSTFALAADGTIVRGRTEFVFELGVGPTKVDLEWGADRLAFAWMTQPLPEFGETIGNRAGLAASIGVDPSALRDEPAQVVSCGVPFLFVPLVSRETVDAVSIDRRALARVLRDSGLDELPAFVFTPDRTGSTGAETVYSRMLAPGFGIAEDPATGGASGPLGCYLLRHGLVTASDARSLLSLQGVAMRRPSQVHISIESAEDRITGVRIGGRSIVVGEGRLY